MKIRLKMDLPVEKMHGMTKGRELDVLEEDRDDPISGSESGRLRGYWVRSDAAERVLVLKHECEVIHDQG